MNCALVKVISRAEDITKYGVYVWVKIGCNFISCLNDRFNAISWNCLSSLIMQSHIVSNETKKDRSNQEFNAIKYASDECIDSHFANFVCCTFLVMSPV